MKKGWGGRRPDTGRPRKHPFALAQAQERHLTRLVRQTQRDPLLRRLTELERAVGLVEKPEAPSHSRRRRQSSCDETESNGRCLL